MSQNDKSPLLPITRADFFWKQSHPEYCPVRCSSVLLKPHQCSVTSIGKRKLSSMLVSRLFQQGVEKSTARKSQMNSLYTKQLPSRFVKQIDEENPDFPVSNMWNLVIDRLDGNEPPSDTKNKRKFVVALSLFIRALCKMIKMHHRCVHGIIARGHSLAWDCHF